MSAVDTPVKGHVHVAFDQMLCPVAGCTSGKGKLPQQGAVPGIKAHVRRVHPEFDFDSIAWPAIRSADGPMAGESKETLFRAAQSRGLIGKDASPAKHSKVDLLQLLAQGKS